MRISWFKNLLEERDNNIEENLPDLSFNLQRKTIYLLLHKYGFFSSFFEENDSSELSKKAIASLVLTMLGDDIKKKAHEYKYVRGTSLEKLHEHNSENCMTESSLRQIKRLSNELELPKMNEWAEDLLDKFYPNWQD